MRPSIPKDNNRFMLIDQYFQETGNKITFTQQQASDFAKKVADDFNPLHDVNSKRFCVPGDLLFSVLLAKYGVSQHMHFTFSGMVTEDIKLILPENAPQLTIKSDTDREYLQLEQSGENTQNSDLINKLTQTYVNFSGHTFPHILVPLLQQKGVMINPARPMVMYQSMLIELDSLTNSDISLELDQEKTIVDVNGKRGNLCLAFNLKADDKIIGHGEKHMVVSGLKPYEEDVVKTIAADYAKWKHDYNN
jgi:alpha-amylase/alpha-mannosidase (GH57 family)